ncbi:MAG: S41 family peptidase, partial [Rickettsiales bacterium]
AFREMNIQTKGEFGGLGIEVTMENGIIKIISPIEGTPAYNANIKTGDYIISINDEPVMGMTLNDAVEKMRGEAGSKIHLTIIRENTNEPIEIDIIREKIKFKTVRSNIFDKIAYIKINSFTESAADDSLIELNKIKKSIGSDIQGLVLDLRNNPGGLLNQAISVTDLFIDDGEIVSTRGRSKDDTTRYNATKGDEMDNLPIVVLINNGSASASEIVAGALQDQKRAIILGTKSFGKGSVQTVIPMNEYGALRLTTARYYTPSGRSIQAEGIIPDIIIENAKIEYAESVDPKKIYSEANLKKHLKNEEKNLIISKDNISSKIEVKTTRNMNDYQLARAIDLIKALNIFAKK